ncbi:hypothetical protein T4B_6502 [Trichinella pseudospiralis]|uniref:Uncharacterized protein n=1 Tax=Trichinella pseudospiralis TaxID=6337 RepID=A0A0V1F320_TRIPS|nr:hypothetical protein T4B_6502 [Trichinella pseudospiralis]
MVAKVGIAYVNTLGADSLWNGVPITIYITH